MDDDEDNRESPNGYAISRAEDGSRAAARGLLQRFVEQAEAGSVDGDLVEYLANVLRNVLDSDYPGNRRLGDDMRKAFRLVGHSNTHEERTEAILIWEAFPILEGPEPTPSERDQTIIADLRERDLDEGKSDAELRGIIYKTLRRKR